MRQMGADTETADDGGFTPLLNAGEHPSRLYGAKYRFVYWARQPTGAKC